MDLTHKKIPFFWTEGCSNSLNNLMLWLFSGPILYVFDQTLDTEVWCDAIDFAVRTTLV